MSPTNRAVDLLAIIAPDYSLTSNLSQMVGLAETLVPTSLSSPDKRPIAVAYFAAHLIATGQNSGGGGPVTSKKEGELSISYGQGGSEALGSTVYGQMYIAIAGSEIGGSVFLVE